MRAVRIHQYGGIETLQLDQVDTPEINADDILIKVKSSSINPVDWKIREGDLQEFIPHKVPFTLGFRLGCCRRCQCSGRFSGRFQSGRRSVQSSRDQPRR